MHFTTWTATRILERARDAALEGIARRAADTAEHTDDASTLQKILENLPEGLIWWLALAALNCLVFVPPIIFVSLLLLRTAPLVQPSRFPAFHLAFPFKRRRVTLANCLYGDGHQFRVTAVLTNRRE